MTINTNLNKTNFGFKKTSNIFCDLLKQISLSISNILSDIMQDIITYSALTFLILLKN